MSNYKFSAYFEETQIFYLITKIGGSLLVWIGREDASFNELVYSIETRYDKGYPSTTQLISGQEKLSTGLASQLAKKIKKPVFVSINISSHTDPCLYVFTCKRLFEEIKANPSKF